MNTVINYQAPNGTWKQDYLEPEPLDEYEGTFVVNPKTKPTSTGHITDLDGWQFSTAFYCEVVID